jgi:F-type H+-transporting ATPase subunit epsilon
MSPYSRAFCCEVFTPYGPVSTAEALSASFPALDGQVGILAGHAPLVAALGAGQLSIVSPGDERQEFYVAGGFLQVRENAMTVLAEECVAVADIDPEAAWDELTQAQSLPAETDAEYARRERAVAAAREKFRLAQLYRRRRKKELRRLAEEM